MRCVEGERGADAYHWIVVMSPASNDVDAFHPISDNRERSTAYLCAAFVPWA